MKGFGCDDSRVYESCVLEAAGGVAAGFPGKAAAAGDSCGLLEGLKGQGFGCDDSRVLKGVVEVAGAAAAGLISVVEQVPQETPTGCLKG